MSERFTCGILLAALVASPAVAQNDPGKAIAKAAEYFKGRAKQGFGNNGGAAAVGHGNGETALVGLAMLEAGIPPSDPAMKAVIDSVRDTALAQTQTYPVALSVLFLDRLGDPTDVPTIQMLGVRLYAGMNASGGWGYPTWDAAPDANELARLKRALQTREIVGEQKPPPKAAPGTFDKPGAAKKPPPKAGRLHAEVKPVADAVAQAIQARGRSVIGDDNSNTQFGMIGLWVACRNGLPGQDAFALVERRFLATQNPRDAGWGYTGGPGMGAMMGNSTPAMTCAGLLGLALGSGVRKAVLTGEKNGPAASNPKLPDDPFSNPSAGKKPSEKKKDDGRPPADLPKSVQAALTTLGQFLQAAKVGRGPGGPGANPGLGNLGGFVGAGNSYYLLWSLERMAVAYSLDTIGGVNWYEFGASLLLPAQQADGSWNDGSYGADVNTAFAVLFLTKSNLLNDLTGKIKGTKDPGKTELRGSNGPPLLAPPPKDPPARAGSKPATPSAPASPSAPVSTGGGFTLPPVVVPSEAAEAEKLSAAILAATDDWDQKLEEARATRGGKWSRALATVCAKADGVKRKQARDALALRLTRMTAATLKDMLNDTDAELRRAACLAVAMKEETALTGEVIDRIADASEPVGRAARAALKSLSGVDFGPPAGADEDAKLAAAAAWRAWLDARKK